MDILQTKEYGDWRTKCYNLRNKVVHKSKIPSKQEAVNALNAGVIFLNYLNKFFI